VLTPSELIKTCSFALTLTEFNSLSNDLIVFIIRPPDIVVGGLRFYRDTIFFFIIFFCLLFCQLYPPSSLNGTQRKPSKSATCSEVSAIWKYMSEIWSVPFPTNRGSKTTFFSTTSQLNGSFNGLLRTKHDRPTGLQNRASALETPRGLLHRLKMSWSLVHKRLKIEPYFWRYNGWPWVTLNCRFTVRHYRLFARGLHCDHIHRCTLARI